MGLTGPHSKGRSAALEDLHPLRPPPLLPRYSRIADVPRCDVSFGVVPTKGLNAHQKRTYIG